MNKNAKFVGAAILSLSAAFNAACTTISLPGLANDNNPATDDMRSMGQFFSKYSPVPVFMIDRKLAVDISRSPSDKKTAPEKLLTHIQKTTGITLSDYSLYQLSSAIGDGAPASFQNMTVEKDEQYKANLCLVFADLVADPTEMGIVYAMSKLTQEDMSKITPDVILANITMPTETGARLIKLHEGFHCTDTIYRARLRELSKKLPASYENYAQGSQTNLEISLIGNKMEIYADVAASLKIAQEGHADILPAQAAMRALMQVYDHHTLMNDPQAAFPHIRNAANMSADHTTGWPDNLIYVPVPGYAHNTTKGLLAAIDFVKNTPEEQIRNLSMEQIMQKAYEITESVSPSLDEFRGLTFQFYKTIRKALGETIDPTQIKDICPPPCASAITGEQRALGEIAREAYLNTQNQALAPYRKTAPKAP